VGLLVGPGSGISFTAHNPTNHVPRVIGIAGFGTDSPGGTVSVADNGTSPEIRVQVVNTLGDGTAAGTEAGW